VRISECNWPQVEQYLRKDDRAILPLGSTEQHAQLSLSVDSILSERVATEAAEPLGIPVFPVVAYGLTPYFTAYPGSISLRTETYIRLVRDILDGMRAQGFRRILIVNGTQQALTLCAQSLLQTGDRFWIDDPGYVNARAVFTLYGGKPCPIPVTADGMDIDYAFQHFPEGRLAYLTPSHQDPVGGTLPLAQRLRLLTWARDHRQWLIEDDYDSELRYRGKPIPSLQGLDTHGNVIYIGTFSKVLFPALRVAYMVLPDREIFQAFKALKALNDRQTALTDQLILTDFIKEGYFHRHLRKMRAVYSSRLQCLLDELRAHLSDFLSFTDPSAGMHLAAFFKKPMDEERLILAAAARGLVLHGLRDYTIDRYDRPGILLGYASFSEEKIRVAVSALKEVFQAIS